MTTKEYFQFYPKRNVCFVTSDGNIFHEETDAVNYAKDLEDSSVKVVSNQKEKTVEATEMEQEDVITGGEETSPQSSTPNPKKTKK